MTDELADTEIELPDGSDPEAQERGGVEEFEMSAALPTATLDQLDEEVLAALSAEEVGELSSETMAGMALASLRLSPHFQLREFHCRDGTPVPRAAIGGLRSLCNQVLEPLRARFGVCRVTSGYRTAAYNRRIGGASDSQHIYDNSPDSVAADVVFAGGNSRQWYAYADRILRNGGGVGYYSSFVHVDNRQVRARWSG